MKKFFAPTRIFIVLFLLCAGCAQAQQKISFDLAAIRQTFHKVNGLNLSTFYHFNEKLAAGVEMNRFFPVVHKEAELSAWDFDFNAHYLLNLHHHFYFYPIAGFSHTFSREVSTEPMGEALNDRFWSVNAGAGLVWQKGKWGLHTEFLYTWGHFNQEFLLAGLNYEIELGRHHKQHKEH